MLSGQWPLTSLQEHQPCLGGWWECGRWEWGGGGVCQVGGGRNRPTRCDAPCGREQGPWQAGPCWRVHRHSYEFACGFEPYFPFWAPFWREALGSGHGALPGCAALLDPMLQALEQLGAPAHAAPLAWMPFSIVCLCLTKLVLEVLLWEASRGQAMSSAPHPTTR